MVKFFKEISWVTYIYWNIKEVHAELLFHRSKHFHFLVPRTQWTQEFIDYEASMWQLEEQIKKYNRVSKANKDCKECIFKVIAMFCLASASSQSPARWSGEGMGKEKEWVFSQGHTAEPRLDWLPSKASPTAVTSVRTVSSTLLAPSLFTHVSFLSMLSVHTNKKNFKYII